LTAGQQCTIIVRVQGIALGAHVNTTSQVTATGTPNGGPASATLTVIGPPTAVPTLSVWMLSVLAAALAAMAAVKLRG
ncbi:MAG TPA: IPTL-CTERM sorting domain-containing protein, partial [Vicinamibacterales bacterium]|nr:IPTL-CTERM sorting domain-containing protein [Vicinamibacterales bacterium]